MIVMSFLTGKHPTYLRTNRTNEDFPNQRDVRVTFQRFLLTSL